MLSAADIKLLTEVFQRYPEIEAVYLFGSVAAGKTHAESDLDLAIATRDAKLRYRKLDILTDLTRSGFDDIDLVFLNTADTITQYEALRQNCLIYRTASFDHGAYYSKIIRQYLDMVPFLERQRNAYKQRLLSGQT